MKNNVLKTTRAQTLKKHLFYNIFLIFLLGSRAGLGFARFSGGLRAGLGFARIGGGLLAGLGFARFGVGLRAGPGSARFGGGLRAGLGSARFGGGLRAGLGSARLGGGLRAGLGPARFGGDLRAKLGRCVFVVLVVALRGRKRCKTQGFLNILRRNRSANSGCYGSGRRAAFDNPFKKLARSRRKKLANRNVF